MRFLLGLVMLLSATQALSAQEKSWPRELAKTEWLGVSSQDDVMLITFGPAGKALVSTVKRARTISGYRMVGTPITRRAEWYVINDVTLCLRFVTKKGVALGEPSCEEAKLRGDVLWWGISEFKRRPYEGLDI